MNRGFEQKKAAIPLGVPTPTFSSWESGRTEPSIERLLKLARYYDVSVDRLLSSDKALSVGSWIPLGKDPKFHPVKFPEIFYSLMIYGLVFNRLFFFDIYERRFYVELIDSWKIDRDNSSYIFYVRRDIWLELHNLPTPYIIPRAYEVDDQFWVV